MAIKRFQQGSTADLTLFNTWLDANKAGTFLDNVTITFDSDSNNIITFSTENSSLKLTLRSSGTSSAEVARFTTNGHYWTANTVSIASATALLSSAILSKYGIIFDLYGVSASGTGTTSFHGYTVAVTIDSNGEIAALLPNESVIKSGGTNMSSWMVLAGGSTVGMSRSSTPFYGASRTSLAPLAAQGSDDDLALPYAYAAVSTQIDGMGLHSVSVDGTPFISNGVWYIRDDN